MNRNLQPLDEDRCWQAVVERDHRWDGRFVMGVRSTGIYCRPGCPARQPNRAQARFFHSSAEAEAAGFRACKRCRPNAPLRPAAELAERAAQLIEAALQAGDSPTLAALGEQLNTSPYHLQRTFKAIKGLTPRQYAAALRAQRLKAGLRGGQPVTEALYEAGYSASSRLYEASPGALGMPPGAYQRGGAGMHIRYTLIETRLGCLLLAASPRGICATMFGEEPAVLENALAEEFPRAERERDDAALAGWAQTLREHLQSASPLPDLPLDLQGTAFQQRVWAELRRIPYGQTRSYTEVAQAIGQPSAVRAVARACATNKVALLIPCHRVVRSGGQLAGYRWGLARKQALLAEEQKK